MSIHFDSLIISICITIYSSSPIYFTMIIVIVLWLELFNSTSSSCYLNQGLVRGLSGLIELGKMLECFLYIPFILNKFDTTTNDVLFNFAN